VSEFMPFIVIGLTIGSVYGLAATGLVLTYKTSGIFNFAYGALASVSVFVFYELHVRHHWPWPIAAVACVFVLGPVMGVLLELLARQLMGADRTLQIAAMVGLILWTVALTDVWFRNVRGRFRPFLPTRTVRVFDVNLQWQQIIVAIIAFVGAGALYCFLRFTRRGIEMRAVVDDPELLSVSGTSATGVRRSAWIIGSSFAALSGLLIAPSLQMSALVLTLLVVQAFGAAAIGYFSNLPLTYLGGLLIGVGGSLATKYVVDVPWLIGLPASLPFVVLFVVLLVTPRAKLVTRSFVVPRTIPPSWHAPVQVRIVCGALFVGLLCFIPKLVGTDLASYTNALVLVILVLSLGLLVRTSRQVSLCQYGFAAIGAAAMAHFTSGGLPWLVALFLAALVAVPVGAFIAIPAIRLSGVFLALATLGFGILLEQMVYTQGWMFGATANGLKAARPSLSVGALHLGSDDSMYYVVLAFAVLVSIAVAVLTATRLGKLLRAMGDSALALDTYGLNVNVTRVLVFCMSAFIAALAGALTASVNTYAIGDNFPAFSSLTLVAVVAVVVVGDPWYAFIAAAALTILPLYATGQNVASYIIALFGIGAVLIPTFRHKLRGMPRVVREAVDRLGGRRAPRVRVPTGTPAATSSTSALHREPTGLEIANLTIRYGGVAAVDDVSLVALPATITGLIGPNGAGKTSTFNACSGLLRPSGGRILLHGVDVTRTSPSRRARLGLGRTFQRVQLFESLDVSTNVQLARECAVAGKNPFRQVIGRASDRREIDWATAEAIEITGIASFLDMPVEHLSTGQRRLVELTRVLAAPFDMILLDEPSSGLDRAETAQFGEILQRVVAERGVGILLVEHDMTLVEQTCDRVCVLDFGRLIFDGTAQQMLGADVVRVAYLGDEEDNADLIRAESSLGRTHFAKPS
jgi:ABC-type branched-subunit amino acid transport system ATPase component/branched-subunit amino acid ABC-type transport system permease component